MFADMILLSCVRIFVIVLQSSQSMLPFLAEGLLIVIGEMLKLYLEFFCNSFLVAERAQHEHTSI
jgi:hypothetical protein